MLFQRQYKAMGAFDSTITVVMTGKKDEVAIEIRTDDSQNAFFMPKEIILDIASAIKNGGV